MSAPKLRTILGSWLVRAPGWADLLPGALRFFARIRSFDIACPGCGDVWHCSRPRKGTAGPLPRGRWDTRTNTFTCPSCGKAWVLGIVAWPRGTQLGIPIDAVPDLAQILRLSQGSGHAMPAPREGSRDGANVLIVEELDPNKGSQNGTE